MTPTKRVISLLAAGGLALTIAGAAATTAGASVKSHPMVAAKLTARGPGGPMIRANGSTTTNGGLPTISINWSGYAVLTKTKFTYVHSEWVQPAITCHGVPYQYTSEWVGLDGFNDSTVEQDGTGAHCGGANHKTPLYVAWYEMYPLGSFNVFPVKPGDVIEASVRYVSSTKMFDLTISDVSSNKTSSTSAACNACQRSSAEWINERPALCNPFPTNCFITALADFGTATMTDATAKDGNGAEGIGSFKNSIPIFLVQPLHSGGFVTIAVTGPIDKSIDGYAETWLSSGKPVPITLSTKH